MSCSLDETSWQKGVSQFLINRFLICETLLYWVKLFLVKHLLVGHFEIHSLEGYTVTTGYFNNKLNKMPQFDNSVMECTILHHISICHYLWEHPLPYKKYDYYAIARQTRQK